MLRRSLAALLLLLMLLPLALHGVWADEGDNDPDPDQTKDEIAMGNAASKQFEQAMPHVVTSGPTVDHLRSLLKRLSKATGRTDLPYSVKLVDIPDVNAVTFPGGRIYFFRGLLDLHPDDDMLAGVMGHELAHAARSHGYRAYEAAQALGHLGNITQLLMQMGVGRHYENEADELGLKYEAASGFDPHGLIRMMAVFQKLSVTNPGLIGHLLATHPPPAERIKRMTAELKAMGK